MVAWTLCAAVAGGLVWLSAAGRTDQASAAASVLGTVTGLMGLLTVWAWRGAPGRRGAGSDTGQIDETARALARMVRRQWEDEAVLRQLFAPAPLPVRWAPRLPRDPADSHGPTATADSARADDPEALMRLFRGVPGRRLVVLGPAGSGKTTFAVLLTLALLRTRTPDEPVPVLCPLATFDPTRENARDWLRRRVTEDYPALGDVPRYGTESIVDLLTEHRLLPVLDGLDEVPRPRRAAVLAALDDTLPTDAPLVLTCRTDDYARIVRHSAPLANATVLEPVPLRVADALAALRHTSPADRRAAWDDLSEHLERHPESPLARVLTGPLMATLVRSVYGGGDRDPRELTDQRRFPTVPALEHHLLDALVPTLYARSRRQDPTRRWGPDRAHGYLTFLARGLSRHGTFDLAWWQLHTWSPALAGPWRRAAVWTGVALIGHLVTNPFLVPLGAPVRFVPLSVALAFVVGPVVALSSRLAPAATTPVRRAAASTAVAVVGGLASVPAVAPFLPAGNGVQRTLVAVAFAAPCLMLVVLAAGLPVPPGLPSRGRPSTAHWRRRLPRALLGVACTAFCCGVSFASYSAYVLRGGEPHFATSLRDGLVVGAALGLLLVFFRWIRAPHPSDEHETVEGTLRADRLIALLSGAAGTALLVVPDAGVRTSVWFTSTLGDFAIVAAVRLLDVGATGFVLALATCAWPYYVVARCQFALGGRLPWRLQGFLADAHRLGILRRVGSTYQFRHARLQDHLTERVHLPEPRPCADLPGRHTSAAP
ncbi:NACHT domain-containing protein [Streptomyces sp. NPDC047315]|uniref:NACHT domain-containing protein n=1 Tax=Streptomyces sp. NPDC047315 TaxID=3155142 RepID=UPI0034040620